MLLLVVVSVACTLHAVAGDTQLAASDFGSYRNNPIKEVWYKSMTACSTGRGNRNNQINVPTKVVAHLTTKIDNAHRVNFGSGASTIMSKRCQQSGDEKGHLVGAMFNGPPAWYNLVPQHESVNRNVGQSRNHGRKIMDQWYEAELEARDWIGSGSNRWVKWTVEVDYCGNHPRASHFRVSSKMYEGQRMERETSAAVSNRLSDTFFCRG